MNEICDALPQGLHLFDLPQPRAGFRRFISSWFFVDPKGRRILVDPGPANTIPILFDGLSAVTDGVDFVLLTHIHLDHSGGIGQFCERYGNVKVLAHPKAGRHLTDPERLWKASLSTLGSITEMYGPPKPLDQAFLMDCGGLDGVDVLETPGHAPHHVSFLVPFGDTRLFFVGEAAGLRMPAALGTRYIRPTTPPKFDASAARDSLVRMETAAQAGDLLCYAHWGAAGEPKELLSAVGKQIGDWLSIISEMEGRPIEDIVDRLLAEDPCMAGYSDFAEDLRQRERLFIGNSVKGFQGFIMGGI